MRRARAKLRSFAALLGALALIACALLGLRTPRAALLAYLAAYVFFFAVAIGALPLLMVHALTGGRWGDDLRPGALAALRALPLLALLALPLLLGVAWLYPWADAHFAADPDLARQRWYLNVPFFWLRTLICLATWLALARAISHRLADPDRQLDGAFAAGGLIVHAIMTTVIAVDWVGSLVPQWHSSVFGMTLATSQLVAATAFATIVACRRANAPPQRLGDLATLLLALLLAWGYLAFMDFLTAWIADLPPEVAWYWPRLATRWRSLGFALVLVGFAVPFALLLLRRVKQQRTTLLGVAGVLLAGQAAYAAWIVLPGLWTPGLLQVLVLPLALIGIGAAIFAAFGAHALQAPHEVQAMDRPQLESRA